MGDILCENNIANEVFRPDRWPVIFQNVAKRLGCSFAGDVSRRT